MCYYYFTVAFESFYINFQVLKGMSIMNSQIFRKHMREFYPLITKLVCCDQVIMSCRV